MGELKKGTGLSWDEFSDIVEQEFPSQQAVVNFIIRTEWANKVGDTPAKFIAALQISGVYGMREKVIALSDTFEGVINEVKSRSNLSNMKRLKQLEMEEQALAKEKRILEDKAKKAAEQVEEDKATRGINTTATTEAFSEKISAPRVKPEVKPEAKTEVAEVKEDGGGIIIEDLTPPTEEKDESTTNTPSQEGEKETDGK